MPPLQPAGAAFGEMQICARRLTFGSVTPLTYRCCSSSTTAGRIGYRRSIGGEGVDECSLSVAGSVDRGSLRRLAGRHHGSLVAARGRRRSRPKRRTAAAHGPGPGSQNGFARASWCPDITRTGQRALVVWATASRGRGHSRSTASIQRSRPRRCLAEGTSSSHPMAATEGPGC